MAVILLPMVVPKTCPTLDAGSVLTSNTREPDLANCTAVAHASDVLPTPPLPVNNRKRGGWLRKFMSAPALSSKHYRRNTRLAACLPSPAQSWPNVQDRPAKGIGPPWPLHHPPGSAARPLAQNAPKTP